LFTCAARYAQARAGFAPLAPIASGDEKTLVSLAARGMRLLPRSLPGLTRRAEALPRQVIAPGRGALLLSDRHARAWRPRQLREQARSLVNDFPDSTWAAETLNNLATHYVIVDDDAAADCVFRELFRRFPDSRYSERAAWKIGWWAYKRQPVCRRGTGVRERAAAFPRGDTRPAWLYWAGRAHDQLGETAIANERYRVEVADYQNSYYGAWRRRSSQIATQLPVADNVTIAPTSARAQIPTAALIRELVGLEMYDAALKELQYAQRAWGNSPAIEATDRVDSPRAGAERNGARALRSHAWRDHHHETRVSTVPGRGGEHLPPAVLEVIYPLDYWPLIKKYSMRITLDPYLMALTHPAGIDIHRRRAVDANAWGLMQLLPRRDASTAPKVGLGRFSTASLTQPESNIRLGMKLFKDLTDRFGGAHYALASYNAGDSRVTQWLAERPAFRRTSSSTISRSPRRRTT
jgi:soluble lytic murein transglycosylase